MAPIYQSIASASFQPPFHEEALEGLNEISTIWCCRCLPQDCLPPAFNHAGAVQETCGTRTVVILESHCMSFFQWCWWERGSKSFFVLQRQTRMHCQRSKPSTQLTGAATDAQNGHCRQSTNWWAWHRRVSVAVWTRLAKNLAKDFISSV